MVELSLRIKIKTFQVLNTEVIWFSTLNNKRKMDIAEHFRKNMNYLFKGLKSLTQLFFPLGMDSLFINKQMIALQTS